MGVRKAPVPFFMLTDEKLCEKKCLHIKQASL